MDERSERILNLVQQQHIQFESSPSKKVSISVGYVNTDRLDVNDYEKLIAYADTALYEAKQSGRNVARSYR